MLLPSKKYLMIALLLPLITTPMEQTTSPGIVQHVVTSCTATRTRTALTIGVGLGLAGAMALWHRHRQHTTKTASASRPDTTNVSNIPLLPIIQDVRLSNPRRGAPQTSCSPESASHCDETTFLQYFPNSSYMTEGRRLITEGHRLYEQVPLLGRIYAKYLASYTRKNCLMPICSSAWTSALVLAFLGTYQPKNIEYVILHNPFVTQEDINNTKFQDNADAQFQLSFLAPALLTTIPKDIPFLILYDPMSDRYKQSATKLYKQLKATGLTHCYLATCGVVDFTERFVKNPHIDPTTFQTSEFAGE